MSTASRPPRRFAVAAAAGAALLLAGCTGGNTPDDPTPSETTTTTTATPSEEPSTPSEPTSSNEPTSTPEPPDSETALPDDDPTTEVPFPADLQPDTGKTSGDARLSATGFRIGMHDNFDRVVIDFSGEGTPGWQAQYTNSQTAQGAGPPVEMSGQAALSLEIDNVAGPTVEGLEDWSGPENLMPQSTGTIEQVYRGPLFEGIQEVSLGLSGQEPFRVFALEDPTRIVVDVYHPDLNQ